MRYRHVSVSVPALAESANLPHLLEMLRNQSVDCFSVYVCVNNPDEWSTGGDVKQRAMYADNQSSLEILRIFADAHPQIDLTVIDRSSQGRGWSGKQRGVGMARKLLFECIADKSDKDELIVSLDADTAVSSRYIESVLSAMNNNEDCSALAVPYRHPLSGDERDDRAMLRYEIYMRHYLINLLEIACRLKGRPRFPYAFTAIGSAMAFPLGAYLRVGGITPLQGGEDFYLMQKFAKTGKVLLTCNEYVEPQGRQSLRVPFGTGPAVAKGVDSMQESYPLYPSEAFAAIEESYSLFGQLYESDIETAMSPFLRRQLRSEDLWGALRKNFRNRELFVHACQERVDGLRILQFLKTYRCRPADEEMVLFCNRHAIPIGDDFSFSASPIAEIDAIREALFRQERLLRKQYDAM